MTDLPPHAATEASASEADQAAALTDVEECRIAHSARASGLREALRILHSGQPAHDGPSVAECAADDRAYWERKDAGEGR
ncbi:hypothetical protein [Streptomyces sp. KN37]|uniref:hypothetical protein n=1 Tax=Streptomyces sp. KN37 TaxID=3090667 RepID=UPI002A75EBB3|nr:hypothetical protein [Streptomyces sp. KN37]WPO70237.1 hypothetical protein R9806_06140 [Streptomyces sp. KN37]WPO73992.1 hypothetical protein R9806_26925 [Streptomyces sp. KN37]